MKKVLLSLVVIATTVLASQAQVSYGAKAGANLYNFSGDDAEGLDSKIGFNVGGFVNIPVSETFSVQPELVFSAEGAKASEGDGTLNLNYLNIPIMLQYNTPSGFYAEAGPQIGLLMSAKAKLDGESEDIKDSFKGTNISVGVGLGFGARYNLGLGNILDSDGGDLKLGGFQLGVSFKFGGSSKE